jgi:hypothetical protein
MPEQFLKTLDGDFANVVVVVSGRALERQRSYEASSSRPGPRHPQRHVRDTRTD